MPTSAACPHLPRRLQLLCLFSIILNVPFKNLSNKCLKAFAPALRGLSPPMFANASRHKKIHQHSTRRHAFQSAHRQPAPPATPPLSRFAPPQKFAPVRGTPKSSAPAHQNIMPTSAACPRLPRKGLNPTASKPSFPPLRPIPSKHTLYPHPTRRHAFQSAHRPTSPHPQRPATKNPHTLNRPTCNTHPHPHPAAKKILPALAIC